jgi:uncharacterized protein (TIGR03437 family)
MASRYQFSKTRRSTCVAAGVIVVTLQSPAAVVENRMDIVASSPNTTIGILATTVDSQGFVYITGATSWPGFPTTPGTLTKYSGSDGFTALGGDVFVQKLQPNTFQVVYSVLVGGARDDIGTGIVVDAQGNAYVTGYTQSNDFPGSSRASNRTDQDAFIFEVNAAGTALVFSHLYGGSADDYSRGISRGPDGSITIAGQTDSPDFPITPNAVQPGYVPTPGPFGPQTDAFVLQVSSNGAAVLYATYLGGPGDDNATSVAVDLNGDMYVAGEAGPSFPTLATSYDPSELSGGFVSKISQATGDLVYSTYIPGGAAAALAVDASGNAYVCGTAGGGGVGGFPATPGAYQSDLAGETDAFVLEFDPAGDDLVFATLIGGSEFEFGLAVTLQESAVVIAGTTQSTLFPATDHSTPFCDLESSPVYTLYGYVIPSGTFVASFDHTGKLLNSASYSTCAYETTTALATSSSGSVYLAAYDDPNDDTFLAEINLTASLPAQISYIGDAASFETAPFAPLELISIFGKGLGPSTPIGADLTNRALTTTLGGTQVLLAGTPLPLLYVSDSQVNAIVPHNAFVSYGEFALSFTVQAGQNVTQTYSTYFFPEAPQLFTSNGLGFGQLAALNQDGSVNSPQNPAPRGSVISLFGTGGGLTQPAFADGAIVTQAAPLAEQYGYMVIGLDSAPMSYAGAAPGEVNGVVQINVTVPATTTPNSAVPIFWAMPVADDCGPIYAVSESGITIAVK